MEDGMRRAKTVLLMYEGTKDLLQVQRALDHRFVGTTQR
jgi:hypothetical protein